MKKNLLLIAGIVLFASSCSSDATTATNDLDYSSSKTMLETNEDLKKSSEFKEFENLYMSMLHGKISSKDFLHASTSLSIAKNFLIRIGETSLGGYTLPEDIISFALSKYFELLNS